MKQYADSIDEKTIIIFCNDCYAMNHVVPKKHIIVYTLFGNMINPSDALTPEYFKYCVEQEGIKNIVIAGHYGCKVPDFLLKNDSDDLHWNAAKDQLRELEDYSDYCSGITDKTKRMLWLNVAHQVKKLSETDFFSRKIAGGEITIKGIMINDNENNKKTEEIDSVRIQLLEFI